MIIPMLLAMSATVQVPDENRYPEPTIGLVEACLLDAVADDYVSQEEYSWKYLCDGEPAQALWDHLVSLQIKPWEQVVSEGTWLSREFPMGGCFKRIRDPDGSAATTGLSCSVWVPRK